MATWTDAQLRALVRQQAAPLLEDPNITSVGIGYKIVDGKQTNQLCVQFTVGTKLEPEALEGSRTVAIPETLTFEGLTLPTDVVERRFEPSYKRITPELKSDRKSRLDPIQPGASIGHPTITAGTLACLVRDRQSQEIMLLSNWHVLNGAAGQIGDTIVQPGRYDDNRVEQNKAGVLARSFLGLAGDCAVARLSGRGAAPTVLGLQTQIHELGDPELGDRVVKSGRTTAVTYGIVTRIHTISRLNYDGRIEDIGGFEIGPDADNPAVNNEISMGGDSGSAWIAVEGATVTGTMLGLHFGGEAGGSDEYALACYASSVFEKLEIEPLPFAPETIEAVGAGFATDFLSFEVPLPQAGSEAVTDDLVVIGAGTVRHYTHFSLAMSRSRRFARWVAWNIDGGRLRRESRSGIPFVLDPKVPAQYQVGNELYAGNRLDRGHIARRADLLWGTPEEAQRANRDSFYFTNITPQLDDFNQSAKRGVWGKLEDAIYADVQVEDLRLSVLGGPIFTDKDFAYRDVLVPRSFWKLLAYGDAVSRKKTVKAFVLTQDDLEGKLESLGLEEFKVFEVSLSQLAELTGLDFGSLAELAPAAEALGTSGARRVYTTDDITRR